MSRSPSVLLAPGVLLGISQATTSVAMAAWSEFSTGGRPTALDRILAAGLLVLAGFSLLARRWNVRPNVLQVSAAVTVISLVVTVATRGTPQGQMAAIMLLLLVLISQVIMLPLGQGLTWTGVTAALSGLAIAINPVPVPGPAAFISVLALVIVGAVMSAVMRDLRAALASLDQAAQRDPLTGLLNRRGFAERAESLAALSARDGRQVSVVSIDLDGFKSVNDTQGHAAGDALLVQLAHAWTGMLRTSDLLARMGGDEFVLLLPGVDAEQAEHVLMRMRAAHPAAWSSGTATWSAEEDWQQALTRADAQMYARKHASE